MNAILHAAANSSGDAEWESVLRNNITASRNVFEAALIAEVKRLAYASTVQVSVGFRGKEELSRNIVCREFNKVSGDYPMVTTFMTSRPLCL